MQQSMLLAVPPADPEAARRHFAAKFAYECDAADVYEDLSKGVEGIVVVDARSPERYAEGHVPGAISFPHRSINAESVQRLPKDALIVTYCDGIGCNGSTHAALKLAALGFRVKEMIGGLDFWIKVDRLPVVVGSEPGSVRLGAVACGC